MFCVYSSFFFEVINTNAVPSWSCVSLSGVIIKQLSHRADFTAFHDRLEATIFGCGTTMVMANY